MHAQSQILKHSDDLLGMTLSLQSAIQGLLENLRSWAQEKYFFVHI